MFMVSFQCLDPFHVSVHFRSVALNDISQNYQVYSKSLRRSIKILLAFLIMFMQVDNLLKYSLLVF